MEMQDICIKIRNDIPLYRQIMDQIKQMIVGCQIIPGEHLPTVRELARFLQINPATVARAYKELGQEGVLGGSRRRGTVVLDRRCGSPDKPVPQGRLSGTIHRIILQTLSQGYRAEELEAAFSLHLDHWRLYKNGQA